MKSVFLLASTVSVLSLISAAQAQDVFELNRIVIGMGEPGKDKNAGENSVDVADEDLVRINPTDLKDLFASEPTIAVGSSLPISQKLYVNGVEETNLSVTIDGSRQNNKIFHHGATTLIDPSLLKAVSIEPGVAPADAGPGALAGAVQYETKDARDLLEEGKSFGGYTMNEYSTNGGVFATSNALYGLVDGFEYLGFVKYATGGLQQDGDGNTITGSGTQILSGLGKFAYESQDGDRLEFSYERVGDDEARPYRANIGQILGGRPLPLTRNYDMTRQNFAVTYTNEAPTGLWDPTIQLAYSVTNLDILETTQTSVAKTDSLNGKIENRFALDNGSVTAGVDFFSDTGDMDYRLLSNAASNYTAVEKIANVGAYAQARLELTEQFRTSFGGRADFQRFTGVNGYSTNVEGLSGNLSAEYDLTEFLTARAGATHVIGGVPLAENFIANPAWTYATGVESVTANNVYAGLTARMGDFDLSGKVFKTAIKNARTPTWAGGGGLTKDMDSTGFELGLGYTWASGFARLGYADIDTKIDGLTSDSYTGNYLTTPIGQIFTLEAAHTFVDQGLTIGASGQIVLKETDTSDSAGGRGQPLPGYEVFNAYAEYTPLQYKNLTFRASVDNIFDQTYTARATYGQEFATVIPLREAGRNLKFSLKLKF
ncbi:MAG: TonB-dependent receptor [Hoeflea sp.]|nr:TonB-dependent receptor [Hoeflea sp.]